MVQSRDSPVRSVMGCDFIACEVLCSAAAAHGYLGLSASSPNDTQAHKLSSGDVFSSFMLKYYILLLQRSRPTPPCGCRVGVDCACFIFIPVWSIFFSLYSALVLQSVPSAVRVALITLSLEGQEKPALTV